MLFPRKGQYELFNLQRKAKTNVDKALMALLYKSYIGSVLTHS